MTYRKCNKVGKDPLMTWCSLRWFSIPLAVVGLAAAHHYNPYRIGWNTTVSEPEGIYISDKRVGELKRDMLVDFTYEYLPPGSDLPNWKNPFDTVTRARNGERFLKRIVGVPGDVLHTEGDQYWLTTPEGQKIDLGKSMEYSPSGIKVPVRQHWNNYTIPKDMFYMSSTLVKQSFDSRYFGLVSRRQILGVDTIIVPIQLSSPDKPKPHPVEPKKEVAPNE